VALYRAHGWGPIVQFFVGENLERFATPDATQSRNLVFYVPVLLTDLFPWAPLILVALFAVWRDRVLATPVRRLLAIWVLAIVGVFSFSQQKQDLYIFPVTAAAAALIADTVHRAIDGERRTAFRVVALATGIVTLGLAAMGYWLFSRGYFALSGASVAAGVLAAGALVVIAAAVRQQVAMVAPIWAVTFLVFNYILVLQVLPALEPLKPAAALGAIMRERAGEKGNLGYYHFSLPSLAYYAGRPVAELGDPENVKAFFFNAYGAWVVMTEENFNVLRRDIHMCELARRPMFSATFGDLVARRPPAAVLLVSNRGCDAEFSR
jgi:4-amino-4-deoxy-L-arabinose transferase-like glycosyltransferase